MYNYFQSTSFCRVCCWRALPMLPIGRSCFYWPSLSCLTNYEHVLYLVFGIWYLNNDLCRSYCSLDFWCVELSVRGSVDKIDWRGGEEDVEGEWRHENRPSICCWHTCGLPLSPTHTDTHTLCWRCLLPTLSLSCSHDGGVSCHWKAFGNGQHFFFLLFCQVHGMTTITTTTTCTDWAARLRGLCPRHSGQLGQVDSVVKVHWTNWQSSTKFDKSKVKHASESRMEIEMEIEIENWNWNRNWK